MLPIIRISSSATKYTLERMIIGAARNDPNYTPLHDLRRYIFFQVDIGLCIGQQVVTSGLPVASPSTSGTFLFSIHTRNGSRQHQACTKITVVSALPYTSGIVASYYVPLSFLFTIFWSQ